MFQGEQDCCTLCPCPCVQQTVSLYKGVEKGKDAALASPKSDCPCTQKTVCIHNEGGGGVKAVNPNGRGESAVDGR